MDLNYLLPPLVAAFIGSVLVIVMLMRQRGPAHRILLLLLLSITAWALIIFAMRASPDTEHALAWEKVAVPFIAFAVPVLYYHLSLALAKIQTQRALLLTVYLVLLMVAALSPTNLFLRRMEMQDYGYAPIFGPAFIAIVAFAYFLTIVAFYNLIKGYRASTTYEEKNRFLYIIMAMGLTFIGGGLDILPSTYPISIFGNIAFCLITTVAILKYHLLDIHVAIRRSITFLSMSAVVAMPFVAIIVGVYQLMGEFPLWGHILLLALLIFILRPVWWRMQDWVERRFYRHRYKYIKNLKEFSHRATGLTEIDELASPLLDTLALALEAEKACLFLPSPNGDFTMAACSDPSSYNPEVSLPKDSLLIRLLGYHQGFLYRRDFDLVPQLQALTAKEKNLFLQEMDGELFVPLRARDELVGMLVLGPKRNNQPYSGDDLQILSSTLHSLVISVDNARLYEMERQRASELQESEEKLRIMFESIHDGIVIIDLAGKVLEANEAHLRLFRYIKEELIGRSAFDSITEKDKAKAVENVRRLLEGERIAPTEYVLKDKDGREFFAGVSVALLRDSSENPAGIISVIRDISERKQMEKELLEYRHTLEDLVEERTAEVRSAVEELQREITGHRRTGEKLQELYAQEKDLRQQLETEMKRRMEFSRALAHELKTPLTPMLMSSQVLASQLKDETLLRLAANINRGAVNLNKRVDELLDMARGEMGMLQLSVEAVDVVRLLQEVAGEVALLASSREQSLTLKLPSSLPPVQADESRLRQVVLNLLNNAFKFTPEGGKITLTAKERDSNLIVEVRDTGPGIAEEEQQRLFEPYHRLEDDRERLSGLGLGLALCKTLVELHGGQIWVKGRTGRGSTFGFSLPLEASD